MRTKIIYLIIISIIPLFSKAQSEYYIELVKTVPRVKAKTEIDTKGLTPLREYNDSIVAWQTGFWAGKNNKLNCAGSCCYNR